MPTAYGLHPVHYREFRPEGEPRGTLVLIQGLGLSGSFWFSIPERLAGEGWRVLVIDNRGVGKTPIPARPYRMADLADDVATMLDDAKVFRAAVVGISMGGMIAQHVAIRHPDRVAGLGLLATTPGLPHGRLPRPGTIRTLMRSGTMLKRDNPKGLEEYARMLLPEHELPRAAELMGHWVPVLKSEPIKPQAFLLQLGAVMTHSTGAQLSTIKAPTHVVHGAEDVLVPPHNSRILARKIPGATHEELPRVAHSIPSLVPDVVERCLEALAPRMVV